MPIGDKFKTNTTNLDYIHHLNSTFLFANVIDNFRIWVQSLIATRIATIHIHKEN